MSFVILKFKTIERARERERESGPAKIELRGCWDFILGQLQKTIRLQLSLFTNYRNNYV